MRRPRTTGLLIGALAAVVAVLAPGSLAATAPPVGEPRRVVNFGSGYCLQPEPGENDNRMLNGLRIWQSSCTRDPSNNWVIKAAGQADVPNYGRRTVYHIVNHLSGQCLDVRDGQLGDHAVIQQWTCNCQC